MHQVQKMGRGLGPLVFSAALVAGVSFGFTNAHGEPLPEAIGATVSTSMGDFRLRLLPEAAPGTVDNFLRYANSGAYNGTIIHRLAHDFVVQGGGFSVVQTQQGIQAVAVPTHPPIINEFQLSNVRGTVAMAKLGGDPNSATSQWFVNLGDNSANLDEQNGGFTVFAEVMDGGMTVVDAINDLDAWNASSIHGAFNQLPLIDYEAEDALVLQHFVTVHSVTAFNFWGKPLGAGMRNSYWFGSLDDGHFDHGTREGWLWHGEHRWLYSRAAADPADGFWLWDDIQQDWLWTRPDIYPFLYRHNGAEPGFWVYYLTGGAPDAREFFEYRDSEDPNAGAWRTVPDEE